MDDVPPPLAVAEPEALRIRREHIHHEAALKGLGSLWVLGGAVALLLSGAAWLVFVFAPPGDEPGMRAELVVGSAFLGSLGVGLVASGAGLFFLRAWARIAGAVLSALSLLSFPVGTLLGAGCLYLLLSGKGARVCTLEYSQVIAVTPGVRSWVTWAAWALHLTLLALCLVWFAFVAGEAAR